MAKQTQHIDKPRIKPTSDATCSALTRIVSELHAGGRCEICGAHGGDPHHVFSREIKSVRYDPTNIAWLCNTHHRWAEGLGTKKFIEYLINTGIRSREWEAELILRKNAIVKYNDSFRADWKARLLVHLREVA